MISLQQNFLLQWKDDILSVKELYHERKYRRCTVLCSELLSTAKHPLHRTFLLFYQAICYESLGQISYIYSSNKVPLLEQARDAFLSANDLLPLPYLTTNEGDYDDLRSSPACPTQEMLDLYSIGPTVHDSPETLSGRDQANVLSGLEVRHNHLNQRDTCIPRNFEHDSSRSSLGEKAGADHKHDQYLSTPQHKAKSNHRMKLSRSLSSKHSLADDLVPSPLFGRGASSKKEANSNALTDSLSTPLVTLSKPLPLTPINRPLPMLPFHRNAQFILKGKRLVLAPKRKTALATLISRFEETSPFDSPSISGVGGDLINHTVNPTPATERFKRISATFAEKATEDTNGDDKENMPPPGNRQQGAKTRTTKKATCYPITPNAGPTNPIPIHATTIPPPPTADDLAAYNSNLCTFRASLQRHLSTITRAITTTRAAQVAHEQEKRRHFVEATRRRSSSIRGTASRSTSRSCSPRGRRSRRDEAGLQPHGRPVTDARLRSFWSLPVAEAQSRRDACCVSGGGKGGEDGERKTDLRERIERLKSEGWERVRKEEKGWKGADYYEELRREVECELK